MCGIVGIYHLNGREPIARATLEAMLDRLRHRGPDEFGIYLDPAVGLGNARLSIIDIQHGSQPIANEDGTVWIVFNGEVFNFIELRAELEARGHRFATHTDTEVIVHLYEDLGPACVERLNGQFAIAIWDTRPQTGGGTLFLARDRVGILPLFYAEYQGRLVFGSEIKALFAHPGLATSLDPIALAQTFTLWTTLGARTPFTGVTALPPGHTLIARAGRVRVAPYWQLTFPAAVEPLRMTEDDYAAQLADLLWDATRIRLRADVPVAAYLSGGLDSSTIAALIRNHEHSRLTTFSIGFADRAFDETRYQDQMIRFLGTDHRRIECQDADIAAVFAEVIRHTEWPILRTAPAPMYLLSRWVRNNGIKVVLTGEGADEFFGGYHIFKENKVRRFWARVPTSAWRPLLLRRLYPYVRDLTAQPAFLQAFFRKDLTATDDLGYSHAVRWANSAPLRRLFSAELSAELAGYDPVREVGEALAAHPGFSRWEPLSQAQFIEATIFMSNYLLSSQGDRMLSANAVEGRFPFLDHRLIEFAGRIPTKLKLRGLEEKYILKRAVRGLLPDAISARPKQPYRAPIHGSFFGPHAPDYIRDLLSAEAVRRAGYFDVRAVDHLVHKARRAPALSERDGMAVTGVLSTQLLHQLFLAGDSAPVARELAPLKVCTGPGSTALP